MCWSAGDEGAAFSTSPRTERGSYLLGCDLRLNTDSHKKVDRLSAEDRLGAAFLEQDKIPRSSGQGRV